MVRQQLGPYYDVDRHFTPTYNPGTRRCLVPDADPSRPSGPAGPRWSTDHIETFTETGIRLKSGEELSADNRGQRHGPEPPGVNGLALTVDGRASSPCQTLELQGNDVEGVPNLARPSATPTRLDVKCDLTANTSAACSTT